MSTNTAAITEERKRLHAVADAAPKTEPQTIGWHRHRWTTWGKPFGEAAGFGALFSASPPWWQERTCIHCNRAERVRVDG